MLSNDTWGHWWGGGSYDYVHRYRVSTIRGQLGLVTNKCLFDGVWPHSTHINTHVVVVVGGDILDLLDSTKVWMSSFISLSENSRLLEFFFTLSTLKGEVWKLSQPNSSQPKFGLYTKITLDTTTHHHNHHPPTTALSQTTNIGVLMQHPRT